MRTITNTGIWTLVSIIVGIAMIAIGLHFLRDLNLFGDLMQSR